MNDKASIIPAVDKTKIPSLNQKRILAFVNQFLISTCTFLNEFAIHCETKFIDLERKLQKTEASLIILEAKLASIPDTNESTEQPSSNATSSVSNIQQLTPSLVVTTEEKNTKETTIEATEPQSNGVRACEDVRYKRFFKMTQVGVPVQAVKLKMQVEGLDPDVLNNPDFILPDGQINEKNQE